ncbi:hypothetical protein ACFVS2_25260 [Brevibacillus sp. NPDC058079]|uniref:hypothetical protein n=1 Tax=Brevibacillus sp. NPDC058079 TaxID=3346330 RepID=UPI0036ECB6F7
MKNINELINEQISIIDKIEKLEEEKFSIEAKIMIEAKKLDREQLLEIYPKIKDSEVKYQLFLMLKKDKIVTS